MRKTLLTLSLLFLTGIGYCSTFGETVAGSNGDYMGGSANLAFVSSFTLTEAGNVSDMWIRCSNPAGTNIGMKALIYGTDGTSGNPTTLQGASAEVLVSSTVMGWHNFTFTPEVSLGVGQWCLGAVVNGSIRINIKAGTGTVSVRGNNNYATPSADYGAPAAKQVNYHNCAYATYTAGGGAVPVKSKTIHIFGDITE